MLKEAFGDNSLGQKKTYEWLYGEECKSRNSSLFFLLHAFVTSTLWNLIILLSTLLSNTLSLYSSLNVIDQDSYLYVVHSSSKVS
jgi:hypothetical protein